MQFGKTAAALAALLAAGTCATAADVKVYGAIDTGLTYKHVAESGGDSLEMTSGNYAGPRFGLKGSEDLGDGLSVGFILENGFSSDSGALGKNGSIFNRESQIYLKTRFGTFGAGRVGAFSSGSSSLSWYWDMEPFETGYIDAGIQASQVNVWRLNSNTLYYVSPVVAGFKAGLQYSFTGEADKEAAEFSDNSNFLNAALRWDGANARALLGFEAERFGAAAANEVRRDDAFNVKLAGAWQPAGGPATIYAGASWFKNYGKFSDSTWDDDGAIEFNAAESGKRLEGASLFLGAKYVIGRADLLAMVQYLDGENKAPVAGQDPDFKRVIGSVGCHYHLSGRTMLYAIGSYADGSGTFDDLGTPMTNRAMAHLGMTHFF